MQIRAIVYLACLFGLLGGCTAFQTGSAVTRSDIDELKAGQEQIRKELADIRQQLAPKPKPRPSYVSDINLVMDVSGDPAKGNPGAKLTIVEFTDYQCPYCGRHARSVLPKILKDYVDTGKVHYVVRDFPLPFHNQAMRAAAAAHCAGAQGKYWAMHDSMFGNQKTLGAKQLSEHAQALGLDVKAFDACVSAGTYTKLIQDNIAAGRKAGVTGTPSFVIGYTEDGGKKVKGVKLIRGALGYDTFQKVFDELAAK